jgi:hypothetical protein
MPMEIKLRKAADISATIDMHSKISEEIDDRRSTIRKREPQYEGRQHYGCYLSQKYHDFHGEKLSEFCVNLLEVDGL